MNLPSNLTRVAQYCRFERDVREILSARGLTEVQSPNFLMSSGLEPEVEPLEVQLRWNDRSILRYLPTSPELSLKKYLSWGATDIFEIKTCYRDGELTDHHDMEFRLLEWYRVGSDLEGLIADIQSLLQGLKEREWIQGSLADLESRTMADLWRASLAESLTPLTTREELLAIAKARGLHPAGDETWNDLFHWLFVSSVETGFNHNRPLIVRDYPPSQAALAQINDRGWADRFEFYWRGFELANAFYELRDPMEQRRRFERDLSERKRRGRRVPPLDEGFLKALERGLPSCAGIALGLERLFLAAHNLTDIGCLRPLRDEFLI